MTAIAHRPLHDSTDSLLRFAMRTDATLCAGIGLLVAFAADPLGQLTGLSAIAEWIGGAALVGYGAFVYVLAAVPQLRRVGRVLVVVNAASTVAAVAVVAAGVLPLTEFGAVATLAFAALTAALAWVQYLGVRRLA